MPWHLSGGNSMNDAPISFDDEPAPTPPPEAVGQGADMEAAPRTRHHRPTAEPAPTRELPASAEAEEHVIACCLLEGDNGLTLQRAKDSGLTPESFYFPATRGIYGALLGMEAKKI